MPSVWVKWRLSPFDYSEITISDVLGEVSRALDEPPCEARGDLHGEKSLSHMVEWPGAITGAQPSKNRT